MAESAATTLEASDTGVVSRLPSRRTLLLVVGPVVLAVAVGWFYFTGGRYVSTDNAYVQADMAQLSTDVSGIVTEIDVTDNEEVQAGKVLFKLDPAPFRFALENAQAQLAMAQNDVETMKANWREKQQQVKLAQVNLDFAERDWKRKSELFQQHVVPQAAMDQAQQGYDAARQQIQSVEQSLGSTAAGLGGDPNAPTAEHPRVKAAQAQIDERQRQLDNTVVKAPVAGVVTNVPSLQVGHYLAASTAAFGLVASKIVWVEANPKETQLTWVKPGQRVEVTIDTYPGIVWDGSVASLSPASGSQFAMLPAQNTSGNWVKVVQRIPIRIAVTPDRNKPPLRAGMSAEIEIDTGHQRTLQELLDAVGL